MQPIAVPTYQDAYSQLGSVYDPQIQQVNTEMGQLQPQEDATLASLDQAKVNAFRDITQGANAKGVMFSGVPIDQQAQYVGTKYLPAVANTKTSFQNSRNSLIDKINQINAQRATQAQGIVSDAQKNASDAAYKQAQLQLSYAKLNKSGQPKAPTAAQMKQADVNALYGQLSKLTGRDGYIAPDAYAQGLKLWQSAGYTQKEYDQFFSGLRNPNNTHYRLSSGWGS